MDDTQHARLQAEAEFAIRDLLYAPSQGLSEACFATGSCAREASPQILSWMPGAGLCLADLRLARYKCSSPHGQLYYRPQPESF